LKGNLVLEKNNQYLILPFWDWQYHSSEGKKKIAENLIKYAKNELRKIIMDY
jgi:hypothetical protein